MNLQKQITFFFTQASVGSQVSVWSEEIEWKVVLGSIQHIRARQPHDSGQGDISRFFPRIDRIFPGEALYPFFGAQDEGFLEFRSR